MITQSGFRHCEDRDVFMYVDHRSIDRMKWMTTDRSERESEIAN